MVDKLSGKKSKNGLMNLAQYQCGLVEKVFEQVITSCRGFDSDLPAPGCNRQGIPGVYASVGVPNEKGLFQSRGGALGGRLKGGERCANYLLIAFNNSLTARGLLESCVDDLTGAQPEGQGCIVGAIKVESLAHAEYALGGGPGGVGLQAVFQQALQAVADGAPWDPDNLGLVNAQFDPATRCFFSGPIERQRMLAEEAWTPEVRARPRMLAGGWTADACRPRLRSAAEGGHDPGCDEGAQRPLPGALGARACCCALGACATRRTGF